jgi:predicted phage replisome organizer
MADVKWIKIATEVFDNRKIKQIERMPEGDAILVVWFKLLCLAGKCNKSGMIYITEELLYTEEMLATEFNMEQPQRFNVLKLALRTFEQFKMIEIIDSVYYISSWDKYQNTEALEKIREQTRLRVAKHRENQKSLSCNVTVTQNVTQCNATDKEEDKEIDKDIKSKKSSHFVPPSLQEVQSYCQERNNGIDAEAFIAFYESKGWMVGKNKMKNWKSAVVTWEKRGIQRDGTQQPKPNKFNQFPQRTYTDQAMSELEKKLLQKGR